MMQKFILKSNNVVSLGVVIMNNKKVIESFNIVCLMHLSIVMKRLLFSTNGFKELVTEDRWNN